MGSMDVDLRISRMEDEIGKYCYCKAVIELMNPSPIGKILLELIFAEQANAMRTNLKSQVMWMNNEKS